MQLFVIIYSERQRSCNKNQTNASKSLTKATQPKFISRFVFSFWPINAQKFMGDKLPPPRVLCVYVATPTTINT